MEQTYQGLLDEFAGRAMQAIMRLDPSATVEEVAEWSYEQALAMMKERARRKADRDSGRTVETFSPDEVAR